MAPLSILNARRGEKDKKNLSKKEVQKCALSSSGMSQQQKEGSHLMSLKGLQLHANRVTI